KGDVEFPVVVVTTQPVIPMTVQVQEQGSPPAARRRPIELIPKPIICLSIVRIRTKQGVHFLDIALRRFPQDHIQVHQVFIDIVQPNFVEKVRQRQADGGTSGKRLNKALPLPPGEVAGQRWGQRRIERRLLCRLLRQTYRTGDERYQPTLSTGPFQERRTFW